MNTALFKTTVKQNTLLTLIFAALLCMYMGTMLSMYNPDSVREMEEMLKLIPEELARAMGIGGVPADLAGFLGSYFYGMLVFMIPLVYVTVLGYRLASRLVDNGSMAYLLSTPNTRVRIMVTQVISFVLGIAVLFLALTGAAVSMSRVMYPGMLDIPAFIRLNVCAFLLTCAVGSISWFFSCLFNDAKYALAFGAGLPIVFFLFNMIGGIKEEYSFMASLSLYKLFNAADILSAGSSVLLQCIILVIITLVLFTGGIYIFKQKNLPL